MPANTIIPVFIPHLGCPHDCVFCNQRRISGAQRPPDGAEVTAQISDALARTGHANELAFYGGSFTAIPRGLMEEYLTAAAPFLRSGGIDRIRVSTRPDAISPDILALLENYGVRTVELGAQSMDDAVLEASGRGHTAHDTEKASRLIKSAGLSLVLQLMPGLPGDTPEKFRLTCLAAAALRPDGVRLYPVVVVRDTALCDMWLRGEYVPLTVDGAAELCADAEELFESRGIAVIRAGLNPTDGLSDGGALAGAYHPAFGEIVLSKRILRRVEAQLGDADFTGKTLVISVHQSRVSAAAGQHRANKLALAGRYGFRRVKLIAADCGRDALELRVE